MKRTPAVLVALAVLLLGLSYGCFLVLEPDTTIELAKEDGMFENIGAMGFFGAAVGFLLCFTKSKNFYYLGLALLFFFAFGEEISWGQRIFHVRTPEALDRINVQREFNVHNLIFFHSVDKSVRALLNFDRLFSLFWFTLCLAVPIAKRFSGKLDALFSRLRVPVVPLPLGVFFMINYLLQKAVEASLHMDRSHHQALVEIKESLFGVLFFLVGAWLLDEVSRKKDGDPAGGTRNS